MNALQIQPQSMSTLLTLITLLSLHPTPIISEKSIVLPGGACAPDDKFFPCIRGAICANPSVFRTPCSNLEPPGCFCIPLNAITDGSTGLVPCVNNVNCAVGQCINNFCIPPIDPQLTKKKSVCIASHHLQSLPKHELVYDTHQYAVVLCDPFGSCATPGHMVLWKGVPMMMRSYCESIGSCVDAFMLVNSPRFRKGFRIESVSPDLMFTAMAARFQSRLEETLLTTAVRAGL